MKDKICLHIRKGLVLQYDGDIVFETHEKQQFLQIMKHELFGHILFINGVPQLSQFDQEFYHRFQVESMGYTKYKTSNILILGGGDFGLVAQLANKSAQAITVVDISRTVPDLAKKFFPELGKFSDRAEVVTKDCFVFLQESSKKYNMIFADLSGSAKEEDKLFEKIWIEGIISHLKEDGIFVTYVDNYLFYPEIYEKKKNILEENFKNACERRAYIPLFGYEIPFFFCSNKELEIESINNYLKMYSQNAKGRSWHDLYSI